MSAPKLTVRESDGSDGYTAGTWQYRISGAYDDGTTWESYGGGHASRDHALEAGRAALAAHEAAR